MLVVALRDGVAHLFQEWSQPDFSHGFLIPFVSAYLIWRLRHCVVPRSRDGQWFGAALVAIALAIGILGDLGTVYTLIEAAIVLGLCGLVVAGLGVHAGLRLWVPLLFLFFMIPPPDFLMLRLSQELQLISSEVGAQIIRLAGMSVFVEGNIIDLGVYQLQVAEACSGLRYVFPLLSFGVLVGYLYQGPKWQKILLVVSAVPISIAMNSFRIATVAWLVNDYGITAVEGFLHYFQGWVVFVISLLVLYGEAYLFSWIAPGPTNPIDRMQIEIPKVELPHYRLKFVASNHSLAFCTVALAVAAALSLLSFDRAIAVPPRASFVEFPMVLGPWQGTRQEIYPNITKNLEVTDYFIADYRKSFDSQPINLYAAYYENQIKGKAVHSPRSCLPGGGWEVEINDLQMVGGLDGPSGSLAVNRVLIRKGSVQQLVYYWFVQRERILTNEYAVKWYLMWDAVTRGRSDGALIRLVTPIAESELPEDADHRLQSFLGQTVQELRRYLPSSSPKIFSDRPES